ncbi:MAG: hypothetical protein PHX52_01680, partial [Candidatus Pacebacteria bacterium]|nr:hypothetical protein [Candidatus Paceibacterota bacterium]
MLNIIKKKILSILAILTIALFGFFTAGIVNAASEFNSDAADYDFGVYNATLDTSKVWKTDITADAGNQIKLRTYYHNASSPAVVADNATINLSITPTATANKFKVTSTISATGFTSFTEEAYIQLSSAETISFNAADWYHNYNGSAYTITPVSASGTNVTINLGSVASGYAPNDGLVVFYATVSTTPASKVFNSNAADYDFGVYNATLDTSKVWKTDITADAGNQIKLRTYYHNASSPAVVADNATINLSITPTATANKFKVTSTISATGFTSFTEEAYIQLSSAETISFNAADWYHNYNGSAYTITPVSASGTNVTINLGSVASGYAPNDGLVVLTANVSSTTFSTVVANAGSDQSVTVGSTVQLNGSSSTGTGLAYSWSCTGATLNDATIVNPTFVASSVAGTTHVCTLIVTDSSSNSASDTVNILTTTSGGGGGAIIIANAGSDQSVTVGSTVQLNGSSSTGTGLAYSWSCTGATLNDAT